MTDFRALISLLVNSSVEFIIVGGAAQRMLADLKGLARQRYVAPIDFVIVYMGLGEKDRAFE